MNSDQQMQELTHRDWLRVEREISRRSLAEFIKLAWHVLEPNQPYVHGWHIDAIADHLQAVSDGRITRLLINCPPGMMKSLLVGVFWPAWEWGPASHDADGRLLEKNLKANRFLCGSHAENFAMRDNLRMRRLISSSWFQQRWPLALQTDQDTKKKFENTATGWRMAVAMSSMTGERGDRVILDDPHSVEGALSDPERDTTIRVFQETVQNRLNNPMTSAVIVIMQRLHQRDVSGFIIDEKLGYDHLNLPMRFEPDRKCSTSIGFEDPRHQEDELLFPERFPLDVVEREEKNFGGRSSAACAGQFQQRPTPRGGLMFEVEKLEIKTPPRRLLFRTRYWDKAGTEGGGKRTAGVLIAKDYDDVYWILDIVKGQWGSAKREQMISQVMTTDGHGVEVWVEQEPGSGGKESAEATIKTNAGYNVKAERPTGDKTVRAEPLACQVNIGNVKLAPGEWNHEFIEEARLFPLGRFKDQIDAAGGAFNKIAAGKSSLIAMTKVKSDAA